MSPAEIESAVTAYLAAFGDPDAALRAAVADLLQVHDAAERRRAALDQWVSRGYARGRASDVLATPQGRKAVLCAGGPALR
jgi:hypothetical protein